METDDLFGLGMNEEYKDISFGLYASADLTAADGSVIPADGLLEVVSVSSDESGGYSASFASDLPFGSYYVKERTTNGAYIPVSYTHLMNFMRWLPLMAMCFPISRYRLPLTAARRL